MKLDLSLSVERELIEQIVVSIPQDGAEKLDKSGHVGTHFDGVYQEFSLKNIITQGKLFDIRSIQGGEVLLKDVDVRDVQENDFVMFYSGILKKHGYATKEYFATYIELSDELINYLIDKKVSFIGVDMAGAKNPQGHERIDRHCAERGVFIIENLDHLDLLLKESKGGAFTVYTFPVNWHGFSGLPCRVVVEIRQ